MSKAIVEISAAGEYFERALDIARRVDAGEAVSEADCHLGFARSCHQFSLCGIRTEIKGISIM